MTPEIYSQWEHRNGQIYTVIAIANEHSINPNYHVEVVYVGENDRVWCRPLSDWHRSMTLLDEEDNMNGDVFFDFPVGTEIYSTLGAIDANRT